MASLESRWAKLKQIRWVVTVWRVIYGSIPFVASAMTYLTALADQMAMAQVITLTVVTLAAAVILVNQIGVLFGKATIVTVGDDYSYGLGVIGLLTAVTPTSEAAALGVGVRLANSSGRPLRYKVERFHLVIKDRVIEKPTWTNTGGLVTAHAPSDFWHPAYPLSLVREFMGTTQEGSIELEIMYGHPDRPFSRRMKRKSDLTILFAGNAPVTDRITEESDEPI